MQTINLKLEKLNNKIEDTKTQLSEQMQMERNATFSAVSTIKSDVRKEVSQHINIFNEIATSVTKAFTEHEAENAIQKKAINEALATFQAKLDNLKFDIIDNRDNISFTYTNPDGKSEYGAIRKLLPDNKSITIDENNKLKFNYNFDEKSTSLSENNTIKAIGLALPDNTYISGDQISNDLYKLTYNIKSLSYKLDSALKRLNTVNSYVASNDFKKAIPTQEALTEFALSRLSTLDHNISINDLSAGIKIKNLFDNHIWALNKIKSLDGLTNIVWEDFGSDNICIASNDNVLGLVSGSHDKFRGYVDVKGVISINGLEEELNSILQSLVTLKTDLSEYKFNIETKLTDFESRLKALER